MIEANVGILRRAGFPHHNTWVFESISEEAAAAIPELPALDSDRALLAEFDRHAPWVWKDPRLCYTLGYWWPLVDSETTRVLLIERDPEAVHRSFRRVGYNDSLTRNEALTRIRNHQHQARKEIARLGIPHLQIRFEDYLSSPGNVASRLGDFFGLELTADDLDVRSSLDHSTARGQVGTVALRATRRVKRVLSRG